MSTQALLLVDLQNDYFPGGKWSLTGADLAVGSAARALTAARAAGDLVIHIQHINPTPDAPFFVPDTPGAQIHDTVRPQPDEAVVVKNYPNSFRATTLQERLAKHHIENVVVCGAMSHMCIDATSRAANDLGYGVTVLHDACATRDLEFGPQVVPAAHVHAAFMSALAFGYAQVISVGEWTGQD